MLLRKLAKRREREDGSCSSAGNKQSGKGPMILIRESKSKKKRKNDQPTKEAMYFWFFCMGFAFPPECSRFLLRYGVGNQVVGVGIDEKQREDIRPGGSFTVLRGGINFYEHLSSAGGSKYS
jgi:hypothetical protein